MSTIIKNRLWSRLWDPGSQLLASRSCRSKGFEKVWSPSSIPSRTTQRSFFSSRPPLPANDTPQNIFATRKSFASCGLFLCNVRPNPSTSPAIAASVEKSLYSISTLPRRSISAFINQHSWRREIHSTGRRRRGVVSRRNKSSASSGQNGNKNLQNGNGNRNAKAPPPIVAAKKAEAPAPKVDPSESHSYLHLPQLPHMPHRPTREELLAAATGFWSRLKVRFKWFSIRSARPWNVDDWSAFVSWFVLGNIVWILVGTTTFFSLIIFSINTVFAQGKQISHSTIYTKH